MTSRRRILSTGRVMVRRASQIQLFSGLTRSVWLVSALSSPGTPKTTKSRVSTRMTTDRRCTQRSVCTGLVAALAWAVVMPAWFAW